MHLKWHLSIIVIISCLFTTMSYSTNNAPIPKPRPIQDILKDQKDRRDALNKIMKHVKQLQHMAVANAKTS